MNNDYHTFITTKSKRLQGEHSGIVVSEEQIHPALYPFQRDIVRKALEMGSCALFEDCGMGKTIQSLEWARHVYARTGKPVLIFTPLAVGPQMVRDAVMIDMQVALCRTQSDLGTHQIGITNYEMMHHFDPEAFGGLVLDESSILKNYLGKMRGTLIDFASHIPYRLAATATPAPNDLIEVLNHADYLGRMTVKEALALWFVQDEQVQHWRLKGHAHNDFWLWSSSWAIAARKPDDIGYRMPGYDLPELDIHNHVMASDFTDDSLFPSAASLSDQRKVRRASIGDRVLACADIVNRSTEPWVLWCDLNDEASALTKAIPDAVEVRGADTIETKVSALAGFTEGKIRVMVTKPSIAGHGLNWQHCARMAFVGVGYSYEAFYQAVRRCWRYGQERPVEVHRFYTDADSVIVDALARKEDSAMNLYDNIPWQMSGNTLTPLASVDGSTETAEGDNWTLYLGDSVDTIDQVTSNSVGLSVFSPPFPGMYVYTDSPHDMGNVASIREMVDQFSYLMAPDKLMRILLPGRSVFIHITQGVAQLGRDGYIGLKDFRGDLISMMSDQGWLYYGEVTIDKNPQLKAIRTKDSGLMFKSLAADASRMHPALSDMLLQFRKPGDNPVPITAGKSDKYGNSAGWVTNEEWILWARPVWYAADYKPHGYGGVPGISESDVLSVSTARTDQDERHLAPLQLGVIERCVKVWSNPGEVVYSPFAGVGSEGYVALKEGRKFIGCELKRSYWTMAQRNLDSVALQQDLFGTTNNHQQPSLVE